MMIRGDFFVVVLLTILMVIILSLVWLNPFELLESLLADLASLEGKSPKPNLS